MKKYKAIFQGSRILILFVILNLIFLVYFANRTSTSTQTNQRTIKPLRINNRTLLFEVIKVEKRGRHTLLTLKNNYDKPITNFVYSLSPEQGHTSVQFAILPGTTHIEELVIPDQHDVIASKLEQQLTILAVLFSDNSGDGDPELIQELSDSRLGQEIQIDRINIILKNLSIESEADLPIKLKSIRSKIGGNSEKMMWSKQHLSS